MAIDINDAMADAMLDAMETVVGTAPVLEIRTGAPPGVDAAASGTVLATLTLPTDWMAAASARAKAKLGTWQDASADAAGTAGHFRLWNSGQTTAYMEGTVTGTGGGGDMELNNAVLAAGQQFTVNTFTLNYPATP